MTPIPEALPRRSAAHFAEMPARDLSLRDFEARFRALEAQLRAGAGNVSCVACDECRGCNGCTFCQGSTRLVRCHYCVRCEACTDSSHCRSSRGLIRCQHCVECEACTTSSYLVRSIALADCTYCFGCVGLVGVDFHVLNERCTREEYFAITRRLSQELGF